MKPFKLLNLLIILVISASYGCSSSSENDNISDGDLDADFTDSESAEFDGDEKTIDSKPFWPQPDDSEIRQLAEISEFFGKDEKQEEKHSPFSIIENMSSWFDVIEHQKAGEIPEDSSKLGYFGIGNGVSFAIVGSWYPLNTIHGILGPNYHKHAEGFFSDFSASLVLDEKDLKWQKEWIWKHRKAQVVATRMKVKNSDLELDTIAFSPMFDGIDKERNSLVEIINVRNGGDNKIENITVKLQSYAVANETKDHYIQQLRDGDYMRVSPVEIDGWSVKDGTDLKVPGLISPKISLDAKQEKQFAIIYEFSENTEDFGKIKDSLTKKGWRKLLSETMDWWIAWHDKGMQITTPDTRVNDLIEGLKASLKTQIAKNGAGVQASHYTGTWHRDTYPPVRTLVKFGYFEEAWEVPTYLYGAACVRDGIGNAIHADMKLPEKLPEVDWRAKIPFGSDRLRAKDLRFLPLMHTWLWKYTKDGKRLEERWEYLMHALMGQTITDDGLMYFSGDETFRPQFAMNIGLSLEYKWEELTHSAYSAFLFVRACEMMAEFAKEYGLDKADDIKWLEDKAKLVREKTEEWYWLGGDKPRYSIFIDISSMKADEHVSSDVNTQPIYLGYLKYTDDKAKKNIESAMDLILNDKGLLQNIPPHDIDLGLMDTSKGIMTGMTPALFLYNLTELNLSIADKTFDTFGTYISKSGNFPEVGAYAEPGRAVSPVYDRKALFGELWARYRFWEGGIALDSLMNYFIGYKADAFKGEISFTPRLPHDAPQISAKNIKFLDLAMSIVYERTENGVRFELESVGDRDKAGFKMLKLRLILPFENVNSVSLNGKELAKEDYNVVKAYDGAGEILLSFTPESDKNEIDVVGGK